jgi:hypothetical protein
MRDAGFQPVRRLAASVCPVSSSERAPAPGDPYALGSVTGRPPLTFAGRFRPGAAAVSLDDAPADVQAESGAGQAAGLRWRGAVETLKQPWNLVRRDSQAPVADCDLDLYKRRGMGSGDIKVRRHRIKVVESGRGYTGSMAG